MAKQRCHFHRAFGLLLVISLSGCSTVKFLGQAGYGQLKLMNRTRPVESVLKDDRTPASLKRLLSEVEAVKRFGEENGLKPTANYRDFVKLDGPYVVYVVSACQPLKFEPKVWSFPIAGSFSYLGWFDEEDAREYAASVREQGLDVDVRGASAFSTLGWFSDPILSSMIGAGDGAMGSLVNVVLHESVHATFYINGQSYFNESFASFVADQLTPGYLATAPNVRAKERETYLEYEKRGKARAEKMRAAYDELDRLYKAENSDAQKLGQKAKILSSLKKDLGIQRDINNATLIQYRTYGVGMKDFEAIYSACGSDWKRFWKHISKLNESSFETKMREDLHPVLSKLLEREC